MLKTNILSLKNNLNKLLSTTEGSEGPVYKAAYNAYFNAINSEINSESNDSDAKTALESAKTELAQNIKDKSKQFAIDFCNGLKENNFMETIADEVDSHIKSMKIVATVLPQGLATIISPAGPCTGSLVIDDPTTATIEII